MKPTLAMTLLVGLVFGQSEPPAFKPEWSVVLPPNSMANGRFWCSLIGAGPHGLLAP